MSPCCWFKAIYKSPWCLTFSCFPPSPLSTSSLVFQVVICPVSKFTIIIYNGWKGDLIEFSGVLKWTNLWPTLLNSFIGALSSGLFILLLLLLAFFCQCIGEKVLHIQGALLNYHQGYKTIHKNALPCPPQLQWKPCQCMFVEGFVCEEMFKDISCKSITPTGFVCTAENKM